MRFLFAFVVLLFTSCSIIKDDDITTQEAFDNNLVIERIEISEIFTPFAPIAYYDYSSTKRLANIVWFDISPNFDEEISGSRNLGKLRFNLFFDSESSDDSYVVTTSFIYDGVGRITSISNKYPNTGGGVGTILFQQFNYTYNTSGKLIEIVTLNNQHDLTKKTTTTDSLIYSGDKITSVARTVETTSSTTQQTITIKYSSIGVVSEIRKGNIITMNGCAVNLNDFYCYFSDTNNGASYSNANIVYGEGGKPSQLTITEQRFEDNGSTGGFGDQTGRPPDHFFVSPYIFASNLFENGRDLAQIFIDDWWIKGVGTNSSFAVIANEKVTLDFTYTLLK